jgi:short subunit dehydrogenase-like uncharacterized protein
MPADKNDEIWVLGAAGRTGQAIAKRVQDAGFRPVLVGRDRSKLERVAQNLDGTPRLVVGTLAEALVELAASDASVVVSTVGPFVDTAPAVIAALPAGAHYVDINNEIDAIEYALSLHDQSVAAGRTLVSAAGFGVLGIEAALLHAVEGMPTPSRVRVDALPSVATEPGLLGAALAGTIIDGFRAGGRRVSGGKYVRDNPGSDPEKITTPSGEVQLSGSFPSGELLTAWRASGAPEVMSAGSAMGLSSVARAAIPAIAGIMRSARLRRFAAARLTSMKLKGGPRPREFSWSRARVEWSDGTVRTGWLRSGDGMDFTTDVAAEVAVRLARGLGMPGAYTPGALFGASLATDVGSVLSLVE